MDIENNKQRILSVVEEFSVSRLLGSNLIVETLILLKFGNNYK
jgi:hypothetical protein